MNVPSRRGGFSLVEVLMVMVVLAILLGKGVPAFQETLASMRVRDSAESIQLGLRLAQGEAIRRNAAVRFQLVSSPQDATDPDNRRRLPGQCAFASSWTDTATHVTDWFVSLGDVTAGTGKCSAAINANPTVSTDAGILQSGTVDSVSRVKVTTISRNSADDADTSPSVICFTSVGTVSPAASCSGSPWPVKINLVSATGIGRALQICASSGNIKMCDPGLTYVAGDPMACNPDVHFC